MKPLNDAPRVRGSVQKIRITERDMLRSGRHLLPDVGQHDVHRNNTKRTLVNRHNRTVAAQMLAPATRLRVPHTLFPLSASPVWVAAQDGQASPSGAQELQPFH